MALLLLNESKRDNLLLPYYELVVSKGSNLSFGQFKSVLLEHLTQNGGLRNLSMSSNYYLAGAARYYFNGDLTENKDLALFYPYITNAEMSRLTDNGETPTTENHNDIWKKDVCSLLNKIILFLRNAYIDTMGETFAEPEDFGKMPIAKLLKRYGSKIAKIKSDDDDLDNGPKLDENPNVGNGYTFDIMYSHQDCQKYYEATNPGAWCITYGQGHYDGYVRRLNIHYVVFRKDGWENVKRVPEKDKWVNDGSVYLPKPQDDYGNSLICVLQSNTNGEPVYITSRWNHGAGDSGSVEADHAYTKKEFQRITGVSDEDLQRIFLIWQKRSEGIKRSRQEANEGMKNVIRKLKEFQMRVNGGGDYVENMTKFNIKISKEVFLKEGNGNQNVQIKNSILIMEIDEPDDFYRFIMDKGKVIFESVFGSDRLETIMTPDSYMGRDGEVNQCIKDSIVLKTTRFFMIYNYRYHRFVNVGSDNKFKYVPTATSYTNYDKPGVYRFYEVKKSRFDIALIDNNTAQPLKLPNGEYWFNELVMGTNRWEPRNQVFAHFAGSDNCPVLEIVYDSSSREKYFYNIEARKFITPPPHDGKIFPNYYTEGDRLEPTVAASNTFPKGTYGICYDCSREGCRWSGYLTPMQLFNSKTNEPIEFLGLKYFTAFSNMLSVSSYNTSPEMACVLVIGMSYLSNRGMSYQIKDEELRQQIERLKQIIPSVIYYDTVTKEALKYNDSFLEDKDTAFGSFIFFEVPEAEANKESNENIERGVQRECVYDVRTHKFIKNPTGFPNEKSFVFASYNRYRFGSEGDENSKLLGKIHTPESLRRRYSIDSNESTYYPIYDDNLEYIDNDNNIEGLDEDTVYLNKNDLKKMLMETIKRVVKYKIENV